MNYVNLNETKIKFYKRFLDDILLISKGNNSELHLWLDVINAINQVYSKFTFLFLVCNNYYLNVHVITMIVWWGKHKTFEINYRLDM